MPTIGEVYNPLVEAAINNDPKAMNLLHAVAEEILKANPDRCPDIQDATRATKINLDYYCQYFDETTADKVKKVFGLGAGFRDLMGNKYGFK